MNEIREFAQKIQNELILKNIVIKNIVLYGSGSDVIYRHGVNVAALSSLLGSWIGFEKSQLNLLIYSAILHDFGKTKIDNEQIKNIKFTIFIFQYDFFLECRPTFPRYTQAGIKDAESFG